MTAFYKFPDDAVYQAHKQDLVPVVVLGRVPDGGETTVEVEGEEPQVVPTYFDGYFVNAMAAVPEWEAYLVASEPTTPWMIFA